MHRWIHGLVVMIASMLLFSPGAWAQSEALATPLPQPPQWATVVPPVAVDDRVVMHADASGVVLYRVFDARISPLPRHGLVNIDGTFAEPICVLPCSPEKNSLQGDEFFFGGEGMTSSVRFRPGLPNAARAFRVTKGDHNMFLDGVGLMIISVAPLGVGLAAIPISMSMNGSASLPDPGADDPRAKNTPDVVRREQYRTELLISGITSLVLGGIGLGIGIPLYRAGKTTIVAYDPQAFVFRF